MTVFAFIRQCLRREATRTEPDCTKMLQRILTLPEEKHPGQKPP